MNIKLSRKNLLFSALTLIVIYASLQFLLILRHKSPYLSDSYFYKHLVYEYSGSNFSEAQKKVRSQVDYTKLDAITLNIFSSDEVYQDVYYYFSKRPFYPVMTFLITKLVNLNLALMAPVFISYIGVVLIVFFLFAQRVSIFFATFGTFLLLSFYPYLDWSTYYLTDTIGAFFWMILIAVMYKILTSRGKKWYIVFSLVLVTSLFNREQTSLISAVTVIACLAVAISKLRKGLKNYVTLAVVSSAIALAYLLLSVIFVRKSLLDAIIYTMNSYGLYENVFTSEEIISYMLTSYKISHIHLFKDLASHHLWFLFSALAIMGAVSSVKKMKAMDVLMLSSAIASYSAIFLYPVLSYRYFFPVVISICYFAVLYLSKISAVAYLLDKGRLRK